MSAAAILIFHDAIELFFVLAADEHGARVKKNMPFMDYFEAIEQTVDGNRLYHKPSIIRLNEARRGLKHSGIMPAQQEIERLRNNATDFFEDNTPVVFGVKFANVSLVDLVKNEKAKKLLQDAQAHMDNDDAEKAIVAIVRAYQTQWRTVKPHSLSDLRSAFGRAGNSTGGHEVSRGLLNAVYEAVMGLDSVVEKLAFGIDPFEAAKFKRLAPSVQGSFNSDKYQVVWPPTKAKPSLDDCRWCRDFVVDVAIRIQRAAPHD